MGQTTKSFHVSRSVSSPSTIHYMETFIRIPQKNHFLFTADEQSMTD